MSLTLIMLLFPFLVSSLLGQTSHSWLKPPPPDAIPPLGVPTQQIVIPVPAKNKTIAIEMLMDKALVPLTARDCRTLDVICSADSLIDQRMKEEEDRIRNNAALMKKPFFAPSAAVLKWSTERSRIEIEHWKELREHVHPYLARGVATNDATSGFMATFWHGYLTISHGSAVTIRNRGAPVSRAAIVSANPEEVEKAPVVVYLPTLPAEVYATASIAKGYADQQEQR